METACHPVKFFEYIYERQLVWHNRYIKRMPRPWSTDPVLNEFKFTEVYRENDRTTKYIIKRVIENPDLSDKQKVFAILLFRVFNLEGLFDNYFKEVPAVECFEARVRVKELDDAKASGRNLFNNAYNITQRTYCEEWRKGEKHAQHLLNLQNVAQDWDNIFSKISSSGCAEELFYRIKAINFFGPFLSYQCVTDISYMPDFLRHDWNEFVFVGPGARPGLDAYSAGVVDNYEMACRSVWKHQAQGFRDLFHETGKDWMQVKYDTPYNYGPYLSLSNIQSCFCEWRKYLQRKAGTGRVKYYKPKEE